MQKNSEVQFDIISNNYKISTYSFYENLSFNIPLSLSLVASLSNRDYSEEKTQIFTFGLSGTYRISDKWRNTFGMRVSNQSSEKIKTGFYINSSFPVWKLGNMNLRVEKSSYVDKVNENQNYNEFIVRVVFTKNF